MLEKFYPYISLLLLYEVTKWPPGLVRQALKSSCISSVFQTASRGGGFGPESNP